MLEEMGDETGIIWPRGCGRPWLDQMLLEWGYTDGTGPCGLGSASSAACRDDDRSFGGPGRSPGPGVLEAERYGRGPVPVAYRQATDGEGFYAPTPTREAPRAYGEGRRAPARPRPGVKLAGRAALDAFFRDEGISGHDMIQDEQDEGPQLLMEG